MITQSIAGINSADVYMCEKYPVYTFYSDKDGSEETEIPEWLGTHTKQADSSSDRDFDLTFNNWKDGVSYEKEYWFKVSDSTTESSLMPVTVSIDRCSDPMEISLDDAFDVTIGEDAEIDLTAKAGKCEYPIIYKVFQFIVGEDSDELTDELPTGMEFDGKKVIWNTNDARAIGDFTLRLSAENDGDFD